jgi:two-component system secretion response regulator SsrB
MTTSLVPLRVYLISEWPLVLLGLESCLNDHVEVVGKAAAAECSVAGVEASRPGVVLIDLADRPIAGLGLVRALSARQIPVVAVSRCAEVDAVMKALNAGVQVYLLENGEPRLLAEALRNAGSGHKRVGNPELERALLRHAMATRVGAWEDACGPTAPRSAPTPREQEVLRLLMNGLSNRRIAQVLKLNEKTVEAHLSALFRKFEVHSRVELILSLGKENFKAS